MEEIFLKKMEEYGDWKNALLGGMTLDHFMYMGFLYPIVEETVLPSVSTVSTVSTQTCIISINAHVERIGKRRYSKKSRLDSRSRRRCVRNNQYFEENNGLDYFNERDEKNLYTLGLVPLDMSDEKENYIQYAVFEEKKRYEKKKRQEDIEEIRKKDEEAIKKHRHDETIKVRLLSYSIKNNELGSITAYYLNNENIISIANLDEGFVENIVFESRQKCFNYYFYVLCKDIVNNEIKHYEEYDEYIDYEYDEYEHEYCDRSNDFEF